MHWTGSRTHHHGDDAKRLFHDSMNRTCALLNVVFPVCSETEFMAKREGIARADAELCAHVWNLAVFPSCARSRTLGCDNYPVFGVNQSIGHQERVSSNLHELDIGQIGYVSFFRYPTNSIDIDLFIEFQSRFCLGRFCPVREII